MEVAMIDIISSSIRLGKLLKEHRELKSISDFFSNIVDEKSNPWAFEYIKLVSSKLSQYGLYAFDVVDKIILQNLENENEFAKRTATEIHSYVTAKPNYNDILVLSQKYGAILNDYIGQLISQTNDYPQIKLGKISLKIQQCSNALSTAILRSGVLSWVSDPAKIEVLKKEMPFVGEYESQTAEFEHLHPYNKNALKIINSLDGVKKKIAYHVENIRFVQYLSRCGILQGFFFELFEIPESHIVRIKEIHKDKSIHPVIIETDLIYPNNHLFLFRYYYGEKATYLLAKRMTIKFSQDEGSSTTLYGYCYPTNEYSLLKID